MLKARGMPNCFFFGEVVIAVVYTLNRAPTKGIDGATPYELWHGKKPSVHHLRTFGCVAYVKNTRPHLSKLEDRGKKMVFLGYE
jgi:hypothetical protein